MGFVLTALIIAAVFALFYAAAHCFIMALSPDVSAETRSKYRIAACTLFAIDAIGSLLIIILATM